MTMDPLVLHVKSYVAKKFCVRVHVLVRALFNDQIDRGQDLISELILQKLEVQERRILTSFSVLLDTKR